MVKYLQVELHVFLYLMHLMHVMYQILSIDIIYADKRYVLVTVIDHFRILSHSWNCEAS